MYKIITINAMIKIFFIIILIFLLLCKYLVSYIKILYKKTLLNIILIIIIYLQSIN